MVKTVNNAFDYFMKNFVNLDSIETEKAKKSRENLKTNFQDISGKDGIPIFASQFNLDFGSFARKTKRQPLDDIDILIGLNGRDTSYTYSGSTIKMLVSDVNNPLYKLLDQEGYISSTRVKNAIKSKLSSLNDYSHSEIHSRGEAVSLKLKSYPWTFDIVFTFHANDPVNKYIIPDSNGHWKFTNPKIENEKIKEVSSKHPGKVKDTIRLIKYWNSRGKMPRVTSYVLETMMINHFEALTTPSDYIDLRFRSALEYIKDNIFKTVMDLKGIEGDINTLTNLERISLRDRAKVDYDKTQNAVHAEIKEKNQKKAINIWRDIFGKDFPEYED